MEAGLFLRDAVRNISTLAIMIILVHNSLTYLL
jgi:hypothetical protein